MNKADLYIELNKLWEETERTLDELQKSVDDLNRQWEGDLGGTTIYNIKDSNGSLLLTPLLHARAMLLSSITDLETASK